MLWGRYASRRSEARFPTLWDGRVFSVCPSIQEPSGLRLWDTSGGGVHGTLTNMDSPTDWVRSAGKYALDFDGVNDSVRIAISPQHNLTAGVSIAAWVYPRSLSGYKAIMYKATGSSTGGYFLGISPSGNLYGGVRNGVWIGIDSGVKLVANVWQHVGITLGFGSTTLFEINGVIIPTSTTHAMVSDNTTQVCLGENVGATTEFWDGLIDDSGIWNRPLRSGEWKILAQRRGISYELRRDVVEGGGGFQSAWARQRAGIIGGGVR